MAELLRARINHFFVGTNLKARAIRSSVLTVTNFGAGNVIRLLSNLILTRLLFPEAFGLMALVQVVLIGLQLLSDIGLRDAIVRDERGADPDFLDTGWVINIMRGIFLWLVAVALAAPMANFYNAPQLAELLPVAGLTALFQGFGSTRMLVADRELMIGRMTMLTIGTQILGVIVMIILAWWLQSVWALVIGWLVTSLSGAILSHIILPGVPHRFYFDREIAGRIVGFGKYIFFATVAGFVVSQADRAVLGKFVSLDELAIYNIGLMLATVPMLLIQALSIRVVFPLYARMPPSRGTAARREINRARRILTGGCLFGTAILAFSGVTLIEFLYDLRYAGAGPFVVLISVAMIPTIITYSYHRLTTAAGDTRRFAVVTVCLALIQLAALILGIQTFGLGGAAIAPAVATLVFYPALVVLIHKYKGWDPIHDIAYFIAGGAIALGSLWLSWDAVRPLFAQL